MSINGNAITAEKGVKLKTRIICTIGPKSNSVDTLCEMLDAGMCVVRLNTAHGDFDVRDTKLCPTLRLAMVPRRRFWIY